jgi:hypothetical protein
MFKPFQFFPDFVNFGLCGLLDFPCGYQICFGVAQMRLRQFERTRRAMVVVPAVPFDSVHGNLL